MRFQHTVPMPGREKHMSMTLSKGSLKRALTMSVALMGLMGVINPALAGEGSNSGLGVHTQTSHLRTQVVQLSKGRSLIIDLPVDASDVLVSNPAVAEAVLRTPKRIFILGVANGQSDAVFFDHMGKQILSLQIRVDAPTDQLSETISRHFPHTRIEIQSVNGFVVLSGVAMNDGEAAQIASLAKIYAEKPENIVNLMSIAGKDQVSLRVRIIEVNRSTIKQLGFNSSAILGQVGGTQYKLLNSSTYGVNSKLLGGTRSGYDLNTTSQPVSGYPIGNVFGGATQGGGLLDALKAIGLDSASFTTAISRFLTGTGSITAQQSNYIQQYLTGYIGNIKTKITSADGTMTWDVTAGDFGINPSNISARAQAYLSGNVVGTPVFDDDGSQERLYWNDFFNRLPAYNNATVHSVASGTDSTWIDRSNPANVVARDRAGSDGLNQASAMIEAFERVGLVRTLAEPNLTAVSGESAKFLAGGEFPVPVGQDSQGKITVEFKPFGVGLGFTPVVLSEGRISLKVSTEVSELTNVGSLSLSSTLSIPALKVRRAETSVEMSSGSSLMIAGLLQTNYKQAIDSLPGLTTLPVLGTLFRSRDFLNDETEMVVLITPYIVDPTSPENMQTPADNLEIAHDMQTVFMGRLNKVISEKNAREGRSEPPPPTPYQAPIGYVIE